MIRDVTVRDVQALAASQPRLTAECIRQVFGVGYDRAGELLALAARAHDDRAHTPSHLEAQLMRDHRFSATEARAAQRMILNGEIQHG